MASRSPSFAAWGSRISRMRRAISGSSGRNFDSTGINR